MAEYIEREALLLRIDCHGTNKFGMLDEDIRAFVKSQPTADVAPVVHGRWLKNYRSGVTTSEGWVSSCCDMWNERKSNYCPNCGAKMDGGIDDEAD